MRCEYIVQKDDYKVKINTAIFFSDVFLSSAPEYRITDVSICPKGKRLYQSVFYNLSFLYYRNNEEKLNELKKEVFKYITEKDIQDAIRYAYEQAVEKLKPDTYSFWIRR